MNFIYVIHLMCWNYLIALIDLITHGRNTKQQKHQHSLQQQRGARAKRASSFIVSVPAVVSVVSVSAVCDQVDQGDQVVPAHQVDDIDEVHELDPVHQVDHKDESWGETVWRNLAFASKSTVFVPFVVGNLAFASKSIVFVPFPDFCAGNCIFCREVVASGNSARDPADPAETR